MSGAFDHDAFEAALRARAAEAEAALDAALASPEGPERRVMEAMRYAALGGGKRLRAYLALESGALCEAPAPLARAAAVAVECVHAYSLVHDDLPCMDDDDLRRGKPTAHIQFDEATAVLAGDGLQAMAFQALSDPTLQGAPSAVLATVRALAVASGADGMVGGQMFDIIAETRAEAGEPPFDRADVERLQSMKTGALIRFAASAGALLTGADTAPFEAYAARIGFAFQIADDLLDHEGDEAAAGKRLRKDAEAGKATFVSLLGVDAARAHALTLVEEAKDALAPFGAAATPLRRAADFAVLRTR